MTKLRRPPDGARIYNFTRVNRYSSLVDVVESDTFDEGYNELTRISRLGHPLPISLYVVEEDRYFDLIPFAQPCGFCTTSCGKDHCSTSDPLYVLTLEYRRRKCL